MLALVPLNLKHAVIDLPFGASVAAGSSPDGGHGGKKSQGY